MADVSNADWVLAYQAAFKAANPEHDLPVKVRHWTGGWYQIAMPGEPFRDWQTKVTRKHIEDNTRNLIERVARATAQKGESA